MDTCSGALRPDVRQTLTVRKFTEEFKCLRKNTVLTDYMNHLEIGICRRINALIRFPGIQRFFSIISRLGDYSLWVFLGLVTLLQLESGHVAFTTEVLLTVASGIAIYLILKHNVVRERPFFTYSDIVCGAKPMDRYSFPSGHTLHAVCLTILYSSHVPLMLWVMVPIAVLTATSRALLGLHYPSDILAGAMIGSTLAIGSGLVFS